jgi:biopolymer transport protein TolR
MNLMGHASTSFDGGLLPPGPKLSSEINVTPFVDVMLVLLIIFMVSAPMLTVGVPVDLPKAALQPLPQQEKPLDISIQKDGAIYVGNDASNLETFTASPLLHEARVRGTRVRLRADAQVPYAQVVAVVEALAGAGITQVGLIAQAKSEAAQPQGATP